MDADLQRLLGELARGASPIPLSATDLPKLKELARHLTFTAGAWLFALLGLVLLALYLVKAWRRLIPRFASPVAYPRVLYRAELDRLGEVSVRRALGESRESFARRLRERLPAFEPLTKAHVAAAFGRDDPNPADLRSHATELRRDIERSFPAWRRFLGLITPWSWLHSK